MRVIAVTTTPAAFAGNRELAKRRSGIEVALGLHPQIVGTKWARLDTFIEQIPDARVIGEVGLDARREYYGRFEEQREIFGKIVATCASAGGKAMSVHSVRSARHVLTLIEQNDAGQKNRYALHWFTGSASEARAAVSLGCYFSVNRAMLTSERTKGILSLIPPHLILTETDGPFIKVGSEPVIPPMVEEVVSSLAPMWNVQYAAAEHMIFRNFARFMGDA